MDLRKIFLPDNSDSTQVWHCDPLVIADDEGAIAFAGRVDVEFKPEHGSDQLGTAVMLKATSDGWVPHLKVKTRLERMDRVPDLRFGMRDGFTLFGEDQDGLGFAWHIDGAADVFLPLKADEEFRSHQPPEHLAILDSQGLTVFTGLATLSITPSVRPDRTTRLQVVDSDHFLESLDETNEAQCIRYTGTGPLDEQFTWYVGPGAELEAARTKHRGP